MHDNLMMVVKCGVNKTVLSVCVLIHYFYSYITCEMDHCQCRHTDDLQVSMPQKLPHIYTKWQTYIHHDHHHCRHGNGFFAAEWDVYSDGRPPLLSPVTSPVLTGAALVFCP